MKHYTEQEISEILSRHKDASVLYTSDDKKRALSNPLLEDFRAELHKAVADLNAKDTAVIPFSLFRRFNDDGNRSEFERAYFLRRRKLLAFALEYWLYGDDDVLVSLQDIIWAILEEYTWSLPAHLNDGMNKIQCDGAYTVDLFAAETGQALAETLALVGDAVHPLIKSRVHLEIERRILSRAYANENEFFWYRTTNNWSAVCAGSVGMTAIYELSDCERLAHYIERTLATLENFYRGFADDGACLEGLGYWEYGFGYFMYFADMLYRRTEGEINLFNDAHIKDVAFFYTKVFFKGSRTVSFSDGGSRGKCSCGAISVLSEYYPDYKIPASDYISFHYSGGYEARFALTLRNLLCRRFDTCADVSEPVGTHRLPHAQWYISSSENGVGLAAKAGNNNEPHNHNDVGSFLIYKNGEAIIADIGSGEYTRKYFSAERYTLFCNSSASHSVPIINGAYQSAGEKFAATGVTVSESGLRADIAAAYAVPSLRSLVRDISFDSEHGHVRVADSFAFSEEPTSVTERFVTESEPEIGDGTVTVVSKNEKMTIYFDAEKCNVKYDMIIDKAHNCSDRKTYVIDFDIKSPTESFDIVFDIR